MQAVIQDRYGPLEKVVKVEEVEAPPLRESEVLVRVRAASIHVGDVFVMRGEPYVMRPVFGLRRPKTRVPGTDFAGVIDRTGAAVSQVKPGDEVVGWGEGAFAEVVAVPHGQLIPKPSVLTFEEASAVGVSATTALQALRDHGHVQPGQHVMVVGASGGVGTFAVQIAKALGAEVSGVCSTRNVELVRSIGADHVIDYTQEDFTRSGPRYDLIFDNVGTGDRAAIRRALVPTGTLLSNGAQVSGWFGGLDSVIRAMVGSVFIRQQGRPFVSMPSRDDLLALAELIDAGKVKPVIDRSYPLARAVEAITHVGERHTQGTTVITM